MELWSSRSVSVSSAMAESVGLVQSPECMISSISAAETVRRTMDTQSRRSSAESSDCWIRAADLGAVFPGAGKGRREERDRVCQ